jgi:hypothetical protein
MQDMTDPSGTSTDSEASQKIFVDGLGFKVSDSVPDRATFMRCSTDHHNVLVQPAPVAFLHHTSWEVEMLTKWGAGPPPPSSFLAPEDLAAMMTGRGLGYRRNRRAGSEPFIGLDDHWLLGWLGEVAG